MGEACVEGLPSSLHGADLHHCPSNEAVGDEDGAEWDGSEESTDTIEHSLIETRVSTGQFNHGRHLAQEVVHFPVSTKWELQSER